MRKLKGFYQPESLDEAIEILANKGENIKVLAGGTDLVVELYKDSLSNDIEYLLDISRLSELYKFCQVQNEFIIGPLVTHNELIDDVFFLKKLPFICEAAKSIGSPQIRRLGTVGGNICNASPCGDLIPPLVALDAEVELLSKNGTRKLSLSNFILGPNETSIKEDEMMTSIKITLPESNLGTAFMKVGRRKALAISRMSVAVMIGKDHEDKISEIYLATGSVTPKPGRLSEVERILLNQKPTNNLIELAAEEAAKVMIATSGYRWSTEYKEPVIKTLISRSINRALEAIS